MKVQELFELGMKRELGELLEPRGLVINLGAGNSHIEGTQSLDYPTWDAERDELPYDDESVDGIYAFHFLEHLDGKNVIRILRECHRVLRFGGVMTIVVPHRLSQMAYHDLDHKSFFCEETWRTLFSTPYYDKNREEPWRFHIQFNMIAGIVERNLCLMTQLLKL